MILPGCHTSLYVFRKWISAKPEIMDFLGYHENMRFNEKKNSLQVRDNNLE